MYAPEAKTYRRAALLAVEPAIVVHVDCGQSGECVDQTVRRTTRAACAPTRYDSRIHTVTTRERRYYYVEETMMIVYFLCCAFYESTLPHALIVSQEVMHAVGGVRSQG